MDGTAEGYTDTLQDGSQKGAWKMTEELKPLSKKHQRVLDQYLSCFNQTEAYHKVYPKVTYDSARAASSALFATLNFSAHLNARLNEAHMSADEALKLQADIARGDITQFFTPIGNLDFDKLMESGNGRLVKKIKQRTITKIGKTEKDEDTEILETELELYPADAAQERILKVHGKLVQRIEGSGANGEIVIEQKGIDDERFTRAIETLTDAVRETVSRKDSKQDGALGSTE